MTIVPSRSADIQSWIEALGAESDAARESAIARLTLAGERALPALLAALESPAGPVRLGVLRVLERRRAPRARRHVVARLEASDPAESTAAVQALVAYEDSAAAAALARVLASRRDAAGEAAARGLVQLFRAGVEEALEPLLSLAFDARADESMRGVAREVVDLLPQSDQRALVARLDGPPRRRRSAALDVETLLGALPEGPAAVTTLHAALVAMADESGATAAEARGRLHEALAERGSRLALYDLRERLAERPPRAAERLLRAAAAIGDDTFLAPIATLAAERPALTPGAAAAFSRIVEREGLRKSPKHTRLLKPAHRAVLDGLWAHARRAPAPRRKRR